VVDAAESWQQATRQLPEHELKAAVSHGFERMASGGDELTQGDCSAGASCAAKNKSLAKRVKAKWGKLLAKMASGGRVAGGKVAKQQQQGRVSVEEVAAGAA
jgi:hypothetical protein